MLRFMHKTILICLVLLPFAAAHAQDEAIEEEQEIRRYTVEMIIFEYAQEVATGSEIFPGDRPTIDDPVFDDESLLSEPEPLEEIPRRLRDIQLTRLRNDEFTMGEIMSRLQRLDVYKPVMHFGWTQTTWPEEETSAIELASMGRVPEGLDGTLKLYLSRFLHLVVDLQLDAPEAENALSSLDDPVSGYGDYRTLDQFRSSGEPGPVRYRINEDRIFRSGELRYFDHPKFGVLAKVTRVEEQETAEPDNRELLGYPAQ